MAERSGVSVRTIRRLETGKSHDHRLGTLNLLADALRACPEDRQRLAAMQTTAHHTPTEPAPATIVQPEPADEVPGPVAVQPVQEPVAVQPVQEPVAVQPVQEPVAVQPVPLPDRLPHRC
ncbi:hypothetical protein NKH18_18840 [Streptomyces sp. M10(2022)]